MTLEPVIRHETVAVPGPLRVAGQLRWADAHVTAVPDLAEASVILEVTGSRALDMATQVRVTLGPDRIDVEVPSVISLFGPRVSLRVAIRVPEGSTLDLAAGSGDLWADGTYDTARLRSGSGEVRLEQAGVASLRAGSGGVTVAGDIGVLEVRAGSGDVRVEAAQRATIKAGSGGVDLGRVGSVTLSVGSGRIAVGRVTDLLDVTSGSGDLAIASSAGEVRARSGSGDVVVAVAEEGRIEARSASGRVTIGVPHGTAAHLDVSSSSGRVRTDLEERADATGYERTLAVQARSSSGSITLERAR